MVAGLPGSAGGAGGVVAEGSVRSIARTCAAVRCVRLATVLRGSPNCRMARTAVFAASLSACSCSSAIRFSASAVIFAARAWASEWILRAWAAAWW